jgi:hypothetical protein
LTGSLGCPNFWAMKGQDGVTIADLGTGPEAIELPQEAQLL